MKKLILSALILGTSMVFVPAIEAKSTTTGFTSNADPQIRVQIGRNRRYNRRYNRRARTVTTTRIRRIGAWTYRETIRTTYMPNGTVRRTVIRRQRLNRWRNY